MNGSSSADALVKRIDHLIVRASDPEDIFALFTEQLLLPVAWPITTNPFFTSGGVFLGNTNLEIIRYESDPDTREPSTRLYGVVFELDSFSTSLPELARRRIPHSPPMPFYHFDEEGWQVTAWTYVFLGGLLPHNLWSRLFFAAAQRLPAQAWETVSLPTPSNRRYGLPFLFNRVYPQVLTCAVEYNPAWYAKNVRERSDRAGLDVQGVAEVTVGVQNLPEAAARWKKLLGPQAQPSPGGGWAIPGGVCLRLVEHPRHELLGMVWKVASLNRALQFLHRRNLPVQEEQGMVTIPPALIGGLKIQLTQSYEA